MKLALDTNRYVDFCRGEHSVMVAVQCAREVVLPFVAVAELRSGFVCGTLARQNEALLTRFLDRPRVRVMYADDDTTHHYAYLFRQLRQGGTPIPINDIWIAALCVQHAMTLGSRDRHFDSLPQIPRI